MSMYPRTNYEMTQADFDELLSAMRPSPVMMIGGVSPRSVQAKANDAWQRLGLKMGFDAMTVQPGKDNRFFTAVPSETEQQRAEREQREAEEGRKARIAELDRQIEELTVRRNAIKEQHHDLHNTSPA